MIGNWDTCRRHREKGNFVERDVEVLADKTRDGDKFESNSDYLPCLGKEGDAENYWMDNHRKNRLAAVGGWKMAEISRVVVDVCLKMVAANLRVMAGCLKVVEEEYPVAVMKKYL